MKTFYERVSIDEYVDAVIRKTKLCGKVIFGAQEVKNRAVYSVEVSEKEVFSFFGRRVYVASCVCVENNELCCIVLYMSYKDYKKARLYLHHLLMEKAILEKDMRLVEHHIEDAHEIFKKNLELFS